MALHDTDKTGEARDNPKPNSHDQILQEAVKNHGTLSFNPITEATVGQYLTFTNGSFKIVASGTTTVTTATISGSAVGIYTGGSVITTVPHNLGYTPEVIASEGAGGGGLLPFLNIITGGGSGNPNNYERFDEITYSTDSVNFYLTANQYLRIYVAGAASQVGTTYTVKYYLLQETAS